MNWLPKMEETAENLGAAGVMSYNSCKNRKVDGHCGKVHFMEILRKGGHPLWRDYQKVKYYARS